ncbi:MAG: thiol-disulfide isomerase [Bryobacteraceae bacterium]|nr:thiol-disulfide isomerase [Bryobacteraceae bacterium]
MGTLRISAIFLAAVSAAWAAPTFNKDVAPIFYRHCVQCHKPKDIAPMSLMDYKSARPWAKAIRESVIGRKMPPWFADPKHGRFSNDPSLTQTEINTITAWADSGAAEGDSKDLPKAPVFAEGWRLGTPEVVVDIGTDHVVKPGDDAYEHFVVPTNLKEGIWVRAAEIKPGNREVVHHVHVVIVQDGKAPTVSTKGMPALDTFFVRNGNLTHIREDAPVVNDGCASDAPNLPYLRGFQEGGLAAFLPGRSPDVFPEGTAKWVPPGSKLEFIIHYAKTTRKAQTDRTSIGLYLAPGPPKRVLRRLDMRNFFFAIPAGAASHEVRRCYEAESDKLLLSFTPHMHYRGKDVTYDIVHPDGRSEILLRIPNYNFDWQLVYRLKEPKLLKKGSILRATIHYDNSPNNRANPDATRIIRWGDKSEEEMMTNWIEFLDVEPQTSSLRPEVALTR